MEFYEQLAPKVLRFFAREAGRGETAVDLTAETFAKAFEKRRSFRGNSDAQAAAWLWTIARNELKMHFRSRTVSSAALQRLDLHHPSVSEDELRRIEELSATEIARDHVGALFAALPNDQREAIRLHVIEDLDYEEVARRMNVSRDVARARVSRGLRDLAGRPETQQLLSRGRPGA